MESRTRDSEAVTMRNEIQRLLWLVLALGAAACTQRSAADVGQMLAAPLGATCPSTTTINGENCRWWLNPGTRSWQLVCGVAAGRNLTIETRALDVMRRDSSGVGQRTLRDSSGVGQKSRRDSSGVGQKTLRDSSGVGQKTLRDSSGVGQMLAAPAGSTCSPTTTIDPENCYWWFDPQSQSWVIVCRIGSQLVIIDASELTRMRRDSSGVGQ